jgi:hypothetical protein
VHPGRWLPVSLLLIARVTSAQEFPPEVVSLTGRELPMLLGAAVDAITASAGHKDSTAVPVHVQIDQRVRGEDGAWKYAFERGDDPRPAPTNRLAPDDLVLLAAAEGGERLQPLPANSTEVEVLHPSDGTSRWFYLGRDAAPALAPLIRYDATADQITGEGYSLRFSHGGTAVINTLVLGDPEAGVSILDRNKARLDADFALGIGHVRRTEDDVRVRTTGLHVGPLRVIRESEVRGRMLFGLYSAPVRDNFIFYPHGFILPTTIRLSPTARMIVRNVALRISMDLTPAADGITFQSEPEMPVPVVVNGHGGERGGHQPIAWYLLRGGDVGLLGWLQAPADVTRDVAVYYRDDSGHPDPPEGVAGEFGDHGFLFRHAGVLPSGEVRLISHARVLHGSALEDPGSELRAFTTPALVHVHAE